MIITGFIWNNTNRDTTQIAALQEAANLLLTDLKITDRKHLTLLSGTISEKNDKDMLICDDSSIVIGRVFHKQSYQPLTRSALECLSRNDTDFINDHYWGKYIYLSCRESSDKYITVVRDPTGQLPFFYYQIPNGNIVFSSQLQILINFLGKQPAINWPYLSNYLLYGTNYSAETAFTNISELPPGCKLLVKNNSCTIDINWDPTTYYKTSHKKTNLTDSLIRVIKNSLKAWTHAYEDIYVNLSTDLNSSTLLYTLHGILEPHQRLTAIAYHKLDHNDEHYMESLCKDLHIDLLHLDSTGTLPFSTIKNPIFNLKPNTPQTNLVFNSKYTTLHELTNSTLSTIMISGGGGANVFMSPPPLNSILDHWLEDGLKNCGSKINALAKYYGTTTFDVLKNNIANFKHFLPWLNSINNLLPSLHFPVWLNNQALNKLAANLIHPIYKHILHKALPGKSQHIANIYAALPNVHLDIVDNWNPIYAPFLSQPTLELALAIPSYNLYNEEYDQLPFRAAFCDYFKTNIFWHQNAKHSENLILLGMQENLAYLKQLCLDGHLVRQGLVEHKKLEEHLNKIKSGSTNAINSLINLISAEMFLNSWL